MSLVNKWSDYGFASAHNGASHCEGAIEPPDLPEPVAREIAVITHELRNSLNVVGIAARLLREPFAADRVESTRLLIERHVSQMARHVHELVESSQLGTRTTHRLRLSYVDLRVIAGYAIEAISADLVRRGHRLTVSLPPDAVFVHADGARLEQVFTNLLINAAKYTPAAGDISLVMEVHGGVVRVAVRDSGIGIAPEFVARIFDMFVQVDPTAPHAEGGRGIGLAVVREFVELHGGTVGAASAGLGAGSEFEVSLPIQ